MFYQSSLLKVNLKKTSFFFFYDKLNLKQFFKLIFYVFLIYKFVQFLVQFLYSNFLNIQIYLILSNFFFFFTFLLNFVLIHLDKKFSSKFNSRYICNNNKRNIFQFFKNPEKVLKPEFLVT